MSRWKAFFDLYSSKSTKETYRYALIKFFKCIYGENVNPVEAAEKYFGEDRDYEADVKSFFVRIKKRPPKTVALMLSAVRTFLMENGVELKQRFWKTLRNKKKGTRALTMDKVPSNAELRRILTYMPIQGKTLYLMLASSGMRIGEALKLKLNDVDLESDPVRIDVRGEYTKSGNPRIAFVSSEAREVVEEWLKNRDEYLEQAVKKCKRRSQYKGEFKGKSLEDDRLFPFLSSTAYAMWRTALKKSKFKERDPSTNRHKIHPHVLRKFFRTKMGKMIPIDVTEALMGHEGYLTEVYRRYSHEELVEFYKQGESAILVFTEAGEITRLREEIKERNEQLQTMFNNVYSENVKLRGTLKEQTTTLESLKKEVKEISFKVKFLWNASGIARSRITEGGKLEITTLKAKKKVPKDSVLP